MVLESHELPQQANGKGLGAHQDEEHAQQEERAGSDGLAREPEHRQVSADVTTPTVVLNTFEKSLRLSGSRRSTFQPTTTSTRAL